MNEKQVMWLVTLLMAIMLPFGIHRFMNGKVGTGLLYLFTGAGLGIWYIVDIVLIAVGSFENSKGEKISFNSWDGYEGL